MKEGIFAHCCSSLVSWSLVTKSGDIWEQEKHCMLPISSTYNVISL